MTSHRTDADCQEHIGEDGLCAVCGVYRDDDGCPECGGKSYHAPGCRWATERPTPSPWVVSSLRRTARALAMRRRIGVVR